MRATSKAAQYGALAGYVVIEALIFLPILFMAEAYAPGATQSAALVTLLVLVLIALGLGGLLLFLGLSFLVTWVVDARKKLPRSDYLVVLLILVVIGVLGLSRNSESADGLIAHAKGNTEP